VRRRIDEREKTIRPRSCFEARREDAARLKMSGRFFGGFEQGGRCQLEVAIVRDVKDVVGAIMRVLDGAEISEEDVLDLEFAAEGELLDALNEAYVKLLEFVHDRERRLNDRQLDQSERATLQDVLNKIVHLSGADSG